MRFPMSPRWTSYVVPEPPWGSKTQNSHFLSKICYKVSLCENCQRQSCKAFIVDFVVTISAKIIGGATPSTWNFGSNWPRWSEIADFRSLFTRSDSAVTHVTRSEKSSVNKSTTCFTVSRRWTSYVFPTPPKGGGKMQSFQNWSNKLW